MPDQTPTPQSLSKPHNQITLYLLTTAALILCALILRPLFSAIAGAVVLAVITQHPYDWLGTKVKNRNLCAAIALFAVILAIIIPCFFLAQEIVQQAIAAVSVMRHEASHREFAALLARHPTLTARIQTVTDSFDVDETIKASATFLGRRLFWLLGHSILIITQIVFMLFILFFLFRDRSVFLNFLCKTLPFREDETSVLLARVDDTIKATALGRAGIAALQGILAGLAYWLFGVPGVILWSFTTCAFAMIPGVGAILVWGPIAVYLGLSGHWGKAALLAVWGGVIVSTIDNILYPMFVGSRLRTHPVAILLAIIGGVALFGIPGIILGPVIFTTAGALLDMYQARNSPQL
ncbi:AI-2E family transporter [Granulicella arctica]|uniref:AI-2E family transporter n=1 Tax=Granulicella arctica TaxID=940613 RepID=UPI0021E074FB|nr:AI-2E family transporter [Granulicella arctica]